jgi:hypothetical protein
MCKYIDFNIQLYDSTSSITSNDYIHGVATSPITSIGYRDGLVLNRIVLEVAEADIERESSFGITLQSQ